MAEEPFPSDDPRKNYGVGGGGGISGLVLDSLIVPIFLLSSLHRESFLDARYVNIGTARQNVPKFRNQLQVDGLFSILPFPLPSSTWRRARRGSKSLSSSRLPRFLFYFVPLGGRMTTSHINQQVLPITINV